MEQNVVLEMCDISKNFTGVRALSHVDFTLRKGEIHALMGENGAGKSTLINTIMDGFSPVQQSVFVFRDTIRNNITLFKEFDEEKVKKQQIRLVCEN